MISLHDNFCQACEKVSNSSKIVFPVTLLRQQHPLDAGKQ